MIFTLFALVLLLEAIYKRSKNKKNLQDWLKNLTQIKIAYLETNPYRALETLKQKSSCEKKKTFIQKLVMSMKQGKKQLESIELLELYIGIELSFLRKETSLFLVYTFKIAVTLISSILVRILLLGVEYPTFFWMDKREVLLSFLLFVGILGSIQFIKSIGPKFILCDANLLKIIDYYDLLLNKGDNLWQKENNNKSQNLSLLGISTQKAKSLSQTHTHGYKGYEKHLEISIFRANEFISLLDIFLGFLLISGMLFVPFTITFAEFYKVKF